MSLPPTPAERLAGAVDGAVWVRYDRPHRLLFIGRVSWEEEHVVHTFDLDTGEPWDQPWPVAPETVDRLGIKAAFSAAVRERVNRGY